MADDNKLKQALELGKFERDYIADSVNSDTGGPVFPVPVPGTNPVEWYAGMDVRQYVAAHGLVEDSGNVWMDKMIKAARRERLANSILTGLLSQNSGQSNSTIIAEAIACADGMLAALDAE